MNDNINVLFWCKKCEDFVSTSIKDTDHPCYHHTSEIVAFSTETLKYGIKKMVFELKTTNRLIPIKQ